jgi:hypothetical protein
MIFIGPKDSLLFAEYEKAAMSNLIRDKFTFMHTFDYQSVDLSTIPGGEQVEAPAIVFWRPFTDELQFAAYVGRPIALSIAQFANAKTLQLVQRFTQDIVHYLFTDFHPAIILFAPDDSYLPTFTEAARFFEEKFKFVICKVDEDYYSLESRLRRLTRVLPRQASLRIVHADDQKFRRFMPSKKTAEMTSEDVVLFVFAY